MIYLYIKSLYFAMVNLEAPFSVCNEYVQYNCISYRKVSWLRTTNWLLRGSCKKIVWFKHF